MKCSLGKYAAFVCMSIMLLVSCDEELVTDGEWMTVSEKSVELSDDIREMTIVVESRAAWEVKYIDDTQEWLRVSPSSGPAGKIEVVLSTASNVDKEGKVGFGSPDYGVDGPEVQVCYSGGITLSANEISLSVLEPSASLVVTSSFDWSISGCPGWLSVTPSQGTAGETEMILTSSAENEDKAAVIKFKGVANNKSVDLSVNNDTKNANLSLSENSLSFYATANSLNCIVTSAVAWEIKECPVWLIVEPSNGGEGQTEVSLTLSPSVNEFYGSGVNGQIVFQSIDVEERLNVEYISSRQYFNAVSLEAGKQTATVTMDFPCSWSVTDVPEWVTISPQKGEAGNVTLTFESINYDFTSKDNVITFNHGGIKFAEQYLHHTSVFDPLFAQALQDYSHDIEDATMIDLAKVGKIKALTLYYQSMTSMKGIEFFTSLESLTLGDNRQLVSLDLRENEELKYLEITNSNGKSDMSLDVSWNYELIKLTLENIRIQNLKLGRNSGLKQLDLSYCELMMSDLSVTTPMLEYMSCYKSNLKSLDLSNCRNLLNLWCNENALLQTLNLKNATKLTDLYCYSNVLLTNLDLSNNVSLETLDCRWNKLSQLDISANTKLSDLVFNGNPGNGTTFPLTVWSGFDLALGSYTQSWYYDGSTISVEIIEK